MSCVRNFYRGCSTSQWFYVTAEYSFTSLMSVKSHNILIPRGNVEVKWMVYLSCTRIIKERRENNPVYLSFSTLVSEIALQFALGVMQEHYQ